MKTIIRSILVLALIALNVLGSAQLPLGQDPREAELKRLLKVYQSGESANQDSVVGAMSRLFERILESKESGAVLLSRLADDDESGFQIWKSVAGPLRAYSIRYDNFGYLNYVVETETASGKEAAASIILVEREAKFGYTQFASLPKQRFLLIGRSDDLAFSTNFAQVYDRTQDGSATLRRAFAGNEELQFTAFTNTQEGIENFKEIVFDPKTLEIRFVEKLPNGQLTILRRAKCRQGHFAIESLDERHLEEASK